MNTDAVEVVVGFKKPDSDLDRLRSLLEIMKEFELTSLSFEGMTFTKTEWVRPQSLFVAPKPLTEDEIKKANEETLFWSSEA